MSYSKEGTKLPSQRQLKVGEELRHVISSILSHGDIYHPLLDTHPVTVTCVEVSPNLQNASIYIMPLGGTNIREVLKIFSELSNKIRYLVAHQIALKRVPEMQFKEDTSFAYGDNIENLLNKNIKI